MGNKEKNTSRTDTSASQQGRKPISDRHIGDVVDPLNMTPKEYRNFNSGFWDGVERRECMKNWMPFSYAQVFDKNVRIVDESLKNIERRGDDRRFQIGNFFGDDRRSLNRRLDDRQNRIVYVSMISTIVVILSVWVGVSVFLHMAGGLDAVF